MHGDKSVMETLAFILPIIAAASLVFLSGIMLYFKIRRTLPVKVNCWFCNKDTQVPYGNQNCWDCPSCEQYNGFLSDGSYNKAIPAQHDELLNHPVLSVPNKKSLIGEGKGNGLCHKCNINQELKVQQLAAFSPMNPARYDDEVDEFRCHLERNYRLCSQCEKVLKQTLHKQKSWLLGLRMQQIQSYGVMNKQEAVKALRSLSQLSSITVDVAHGITFIFATWLTLSAAFHLNNGKLPIPAALSESSLWPVFPGSDIIFSKLKKLLPLAVLYETFITTFSVTTELLVLLSAKRARINVILLVLWIILHAHSWLKTWKKLDTYISLLHFNMIYLMISSLTFILCLCAILVPQRRKKMKTHNLSSSSLDYSNSSFNISNKSECDFVSEELLDAQKIYKEEEPMKIAVEKDLPQVYTAFRQCCDSDRTASLASDNSTSREGSPASTFTVQKKESPLDINFDNLSLNECGENNKKRAHSSIFQTKVYGQNNSMDLFGSTMSSEGGGDHAGRKLPLLRPSQLNIQNHVTQSSWVAGGYWQSPKPSMSPPTVPDTALPMCFGFSPLSRSSSQSSGFVSQSSQPGPYDGIATSLPNSRTGSMCGADFDRFSALSEPACAYPTSPLYCTPQRSAIVYRSSHYRGPSTFLHSSFNMVPPTPTLVAGFGTPITPHPVLQSGYYYPIFAPFSGPPLSSIWNPAAFTPADFKQTQKISPKVTSDVRSQSSGHKSNISNKESNLTKSCTAVSHKSQTIAGALKENLFLTVCFYASIIFSALVTVCTALMNTKLSLTGLV